MKNLFKKFPSIGILIIGDLMVDQFIWGNVERISPEAPVPVVEVSKENLLPSALRAGGVSANEGPQLFGPWMSFQVRMERWRKFDPITLVPNCFTSFGWQADLPQVFSARRGSYP